MLWRKAWGKETYEGGYKNYIPLLFSFLFQFFLSISLSLVNCKFGFQLNCIVTGILDILNYNFEKYAEIVFY